MFNAFERLVAFRYLRAKRQEGFISVIAVFSLVGICLGVMTLIIVMSVMNGFRHDLLKTITGFNGHLTIGSYSRQIDDFDTAVTKLEQLNDVVTVTPFVEGQVMATANDVHAGTIVRGMREADIRSRDFMADAIIQGSLDGFDEGRGVVLGSRMARRMGLYVGSEIKLISPKGQVTAFGTVPRVKSYKVAGIFDVGNAQFDNGVVLMPLREAQRYFRMKNKVSVIEVFLKDAETAPNRRYEFQNILGQEFWIRDWVMNNSHFVSALQVERNVMFIILTLIVVVAAFNIISSQIMLVNDKAKGVAIMRTMGASRNSILRIFIVTGSSVGFIGTFVGAVAGISFALNIESIRQFFESLLDMRLFPAEIYFLSQLPARIETFEVVMVISIALGLSFLASVLPAWRAARMDPVEVLRYE